MDILLLAPQPFFQNRGTPIAVKLLSEVLGSNENKVHLLTYHVGEDVSLKNVLIHRIPNIPFIKNVKPGFSFNKIICDIIMFLCCFRIINKYNIDIIHAVEESVFFAAFFNFTYSLPYVYDMDSSLSGQIVEKYPALQKLKSFFELFEMMVVKKSVGVIAVCKALEDEVKRFSPKKHVLRLEDVSMLVKDVLDESSLKDSLKIHGSIIMYVGNLEKYQGIDLLLESFKIALKKNSSIHLVIVGGSIDDIDRYKSIAIDLGISEHTFFLGEKPIERLWYYLYNADILVSPRLIGENTPMKIYSYLDSGKPLVATRLSTHTQVLDDEISLLTPPEPEEMAGCFEKLLNDPSLSQEIVSNALDRVEKNFSKTIFSKKLLSYYSLLKNKLAKGFI